MESQREHESKPRWRRLAEVAVPVVLFAVVAPFVVNGIASAVNRSAGSAEASTTLMLPLPTASRPTPSRRASAVVPAEDQLVDQADIIANQIISSVQTTIPTSLIDQQVTSTTVGGGHGHGGVTPEQPLSRGERKQLADQLSQARAASMRYPTVADAEAGGYRMVTAYLPLIGAHYINFSIMDGTFDISQPEMLLYDGTEPTSRIVGLSYYLFSDAVPTPFSGPNDVWHQHIGLCMKAGVVVGGEATTVEECTRRGGVKADANNGYMVHAWVVPGWDSPQGVFSPEHIGLTASLPTS